MDAGLRALLSAGMPDSILCPSLTFGTEASSDQVDEHSTGCAMNLPSNHDQFQ